MRGSRLATRVNTSRLIESRFARLSAASLGIRRERCTLVMASTALTLPYGALITCKTGIKPAPKPRSDKSTDLPSLLNARARARVRFIGLVGPSLCGITTGALKVCLISRLVPARVLFESRGEGRREKTVHLNPTKIGLSGLIETNYLASCALDLTITVVVASLLTSLLMFLMLVVECQY